MKCVADVWASTRQLQLSVASGPDCFMYFIRNTKCAQSQPGKYTQNKTKKKTKEVGSLTRKTNSQSVRHNDISLFIQGIPKVLCAP